MTDYTDNYKRWKRSMKKTHKILAPNMLPYHFELFKVALNHAGYDMEVLVSSSRTVIDEGLKNVHNDTCYPCLCVVGQYLDALKSGKYDLDKTALIITQTGGGCRASNYLALARKAIVKEFPNVPLLSLNFSGLEKKSSLKMPLGLLSRMAYCVLYGDVIMWCHNQTLPYERNEGDSMRALNVCLEKVKTAVGGKGYKDFERLVDFIAGTYSKVDVTEKNKIKVGIVGEIYVKYSPLGNNNLEKMLLSEGCEPVVPVLIDFVLYTMLGTINDARMYGLSKVKAAVYKKVYAHFAELWKRAGDIIDSYKFERPHDIEGLRRYADEVINQGVKMGEGWLIPAEMAAFYESGVKNIVCAQPFGCLPNHIVGKGTIRTLKNMHQDINIVPIDYDPSASSDNQEHRIKLMLAAAREMGRVG